MVAGGRTRSWRGALTGLALSLLAVACGGGQSGGETAAGGGGTEAAAEGTEAEGTPTEGTATAEGSLEGESIDFVVPYDPGGGYDTYTRLVAPFLEECTGATVVVRNEPGAGGLVATTKTFVAPPEELRIQIINTVGAASAQIAGAEGARFDLQEFSWLGRVSSEPNVMVVATDSDIQSFEDVLAAEEPIRFVATGPGSNEYLNSVVLPEVYGFPSEVITGFAGSGEARAAVLAGDADAHILPLDSQIDAIEAGDVRPILVIGQEPSEELPDVPTVHDFEVGGEEQQAIIDALVAMIETGRSVAGPPGMDETQLAALRDGLLCALENDELVQQAEAQQRSISPITGEEMAELVDRVLNAPEAFKELVKKAS
jgi:tripartite-type tricarboxylate transporter receptor subunit TctC